jgi:hypothetical protein
MAALPKPTAADATSSIGSEESTTAATASAPPSTATPSPSTIPARRSRRAMTEERSAAASAVPATAVALGQPLDPAKLVICGAASDATVKVAM